MIGLSESQIRCHPDAESPPKRDGHRAQLTWRRPEDVLVVPHPPENARALEAARAANVSVERGQGTSFEIRHGPVPYLSPESMQREPARPLAGPAGIERFERMDDRCVERSPSLLEQPAVRHLLRQRMLEGVFQLGEEGGLV